jgi:phosphonatase-like hydrolase
MDNQNLKLEYVLFDLVGTTVKDSENGKSFIKDSFYRAFKENGVSISHERISRERGKLKKEAIQNILNESDAKPALEENIYALFMQLLNASLKSIKEIDGARVLFESLNEKNIIIGLGSGLPLDFMHKVIKQVGWQSTRFDYINSSEKLGKGRPDPIMIFDSMEKLNITDKAKILKIGDTVVDIKEGQNAGVLTAGVLTGAMDRNQLEKHNPDFIFSDISKLLDLL